MSRRGSLNRRTIIFDENDNINLSEEQRRRRALRKRIFSIMKIVGFLIVWTFFAYLLIVTPVHNTPELVVPLKPNVALNIEMEKKPKGDFINIEAIGYVDVDATDFPELASENQASVIVTVVSVNTKSKEILWTSSEWIIYLDVNSEDLNSVKNYISLAGEKSDSDSEMQVSFLNNHDQTVPLSLFINPNPIDPNKGVLIGFFLLLFLYTLIIWDLTDRTVAAILCATAAIGWLCILNERPALHIIVGWIHIDTLMLFFSMMIMVAILSETGIFDYLSVYIYAFSKDRNWRLLFILYMFTGLLSSFLDNVTVVMLVVPIAIRLCETMALQTTTVLTCIVIFSNLGGTLTPVGDPPNLVISTDPYVHARRIDFGIFILHMFPGVLMSMLLGFLMIYWMTRKKITKLSISELNLSITSLQKLADTIKDKNSSESKELENRIAVLKNLTQPQPTENNFEETLANMKSKYKIKDKILLIKCCIAICFVIVLFFMHSLPYMRGATLSWAAIIAAILLLILANKPDIDGVLARIEWNILIFVASLFVFMEALVKMGLMVWIGKRIEEIILNVKKESQLTVTILLVLLITALTSAIVDNIPVTTMFLKLTLDLARNKRLNLPLTPLIWALSFGASFGGNGTLIGASANIMTANLAGQFGYKIKFLSFFLIGFPVMLMTLVVAIVYLLFAHSLLSWH